MNASAPFRCGVVAIVGRPNVGKSTLLNALVGHKISITSRRPQTTRHRVLGVATSADAQVVFVDTPGFQTRHGGALNRTLNRHVRAALAGVDAVLVVVEAGTFGDDDAAVLELLSADLPVLCAVNKSDRLPDPARMLPFLQRLAAVRDFAAIVPVSAQRRRNLGALAKTLATHLPEQPPLYEPDTLTDRSERFLAAELVREKLFRLLGDEVPYGSAVTIDKYAEEGTVSRPLRRIHAAIVVEKDGHKAIVIGKGGEKLKAIATEARLDMERLFGGKVFLEVWVKVRGRWTEDEALVKRFGYDA